MKPDWKTAPDWANYLAMDADGDWYWYENKPEPWHDSAWSSKSGRFDIAAEREDWQQTLEVRPDHWHTP